MSESEMDNPNIVIKVHRISSDGAVSSYQIEEDFVTQKLVSKTQIPTENVKLISKFNMTCAEDVVDKVNPIVPYVDRNDNCVTIVNIGNDIQIQPSYKSKIPIIPVMIRCQNCDINFPTQNQLKNHLCEFKADQAVLQRKKASEKSLVIKSSPQQNLKPFECTVFGKPCEAKVLQRKKASEKSLVIKSSPQQNLKPFDCTVFGKPCEAKVLQRKKASEKSLVIKSSPQQNLKPFECTVCDKSFAQTAYLMQHMQFHQEVKRFGCDHQGCEARFSILIDLNDHIRKIHTRERPFKCTSCSRTFLTKAVYYQHRLIHSNDRRYGCDICDKKFLRSSTLRNHTRTHTNERPYSCEICEKTFRQKGDRNKHVYNVHPESL